MRTRLRIRYQAFRAEFKLRSKSIRERPSAEEIDYLLKVLGPLLLCFDYESKAREFHDDATEPGQQGSSARPKRPPNLD